MNFETVIGLEVHAQLKTKTKIFCGCSTEFGVAPNRNICPVCTGQPGTLPALNETAVEYIVKTGLALNCRINPHSIFARKQYFYPDLPKNYQISQYELPFAEKGYLDIEAAGAKKRIGITRIHLEEDAGKLLHAIGSRELDYSLIDYNRTGVPLMEIVSEADLRSPEEAYQYLVSLKSIIEYLDVSDCDMEEGKFRCDANISIRPYGRKEYGVKAELKNMNTLSGVRDALAYEVERQTELVSGGGRVAQETRLWDAEKKESRSMRSKEEAHDYRYFPEPDLVPAELGEEYISGIRKTLPELPEKRKGRFISEYSLVADAADVLIAEKERADYFEQIVKYVEKNYKEYDRFIPQKIANFFITECLGLLNSVGKTIKNLLVTPENFGSLDILIFNGTISGKIAKTVFFEMFASGRPPEDIVKEKGLVQISDEGAIGKLCDEAIRENPKAVAEYKSGKAQALGSLVGAVMKKSQGKANPRLVNKILAEKLKS